MTEREERMQVISEMLNQLNDRLLQTAENCIRGVLTMQQTEERWKENDRTARKKQG